jgi:mono/diheme cytochrome c family protein
MNRRVVFAAGVLLLALIAGIGSFGSSVIAAQDKKPTPSGWVLPSDAADIKNPHPVDAKLIATGRSVFKDKCQRCHGPGGLGDGEDADPDIREDMDLTRASRADRNPDGVIYHKVLNGRRKPKMPAFKEELKPDQIWAVVAYVQTLRKK